MSDYQRVSPENTKSEQTSGKKRTCRLQRFCHVTRSETTMSMPMGRWPIMTHGSQKDTLIDKNSLLGQLGGWAVHSIWEADLCLKNWNTTTQLRPSVRRNGPGNVATRGSGVYQKGDGWLLSSLFSALVFGASLDICAVLLDGKDPKLYGCVAERRFTCTWWISNGCDHVTLTLYAAKTIINIHKPSFWEW